MSAGTRGFAVRVDVNAGADRVWRALTTPAHLARWCAPGSRLAARVGGAVTLSLDRRAVMQAHIDVCDPQRRLRLVHLPGSVVTTPDSALVDDLLIEARAPTTVVRVLSSGFPSGSGYDAAARAHQAGWRQALARLKVFLDERMDEEERAG